MNQTFTDGWLGRIGLVATAPGNAAEADFNRYRPKGVAVMTTRTSLKSSTPEGIREMNLQVESAVRMLAQNAYCDAVLLSSTAGSFVEGRTRDEENTQRLSRETGCRVISSAGCMLRALEAMKIHTVTLISPSSAKLNRTEYDFLEQEGITVMSQGGFLLHQPRDILCIKPEEIIKMVREKDTDRSDAVLISCSGLHVMEIIDQLEREQGKPVLASNQFGLWGCLKELGVSTDKIPGRLAEF